MCLCVCFDFLLYVGNKNPTVMLTDNKSWALYLRCGPREIDIRSSYVLSSNPKLNLEVQKKVMEFKESHSVDSFGTVPFVFDKCPKFQATSL